MPRVSGLPLVPRALCLLKVNVHRKERKKWVCNLEGVKQSVQIVSPNWTLGFLIFTFYNFAAIWNRPLSTQVFSVVKVDRNFKSAVLCKNQNKDQEDLQFFILILLNHGGSVSRDTRKGPFSSDSLLSVLLAECQYCVDTLDFYFSLIKRQRPLPTPTPPASQPVPCRFVWWLPCHDSYAKFFHQGSFISTWRNHCSCFRFQLWPLSSYSVNSKGQRNWMQSGMT